MAERKLPQNLEAEMAVLGCSFLTNYALDKVCEELDSDMFISEPNRRIFDAIKSLHQSKIPLDSATVKNEIEKKGSINLIGGIEYLSEVIDSVITAAFLALVTLNIFLSASSIKSLVFSSSS